MKWRFQSTRSERSATVIPKLAALLRPISIHALRAERDYRTWPGHSRQLISIHALRAERDLVKSVSYSDKLNISIHALRAERD